MRNELDGWLSSMFVTSPISFDVFIFVLFRPYTLASFIALTSELFIAYAFDIVVL